MKFLLISLVGLFGMQNSEAADLAALDCLASNGVTIKSVAVAGNGVRVESHWGFFRKDFIAQIGPVATTDTTHINLNGENGTEYVIALDASSFRTRLQKAAGTILQPSSVRGIQPLLIAYVQCDLRLR